jgi:hypothetical protein
VADPRIRCLRCCGMGLIPVGYTTGDVRHNPGVLDRGQPKMPKLKEEVTRREETRCRCAATSVCAVRGNASRHA